MYCKWLVINLSEKKAKPDSKSSHYIYTLGVNSFLGNMVTSFTCVHFLMKPEWGERLITRKSSREPLTSELSPPPPPPPLCVCVCEYVCVCVYVCVVLLSSVRPRAVNKLSAKKPSSQGIRIYLYFASSILHSKHFIIPPHSVSGTFLHARSLTIPLTVMELLLFPFPLLLVCFLRLVQWKPILSQHGEYVTADAKYTYTSACERMHACTRMYCMYSDACMYSHAYALKTCTTH